MIWGCQYIPGEGKGSDLGLSIHAWGGGRSDLGLSIHP